MAGSVPGDDAQNTQTRRKSGAVMVTAVTITRLCGSTVVARRPGEWARGEEEI